MALAPGTALGTYEVLATIGAGGLPTRTAAGGRQLRRGPAVAQVRISL